MGTRRGLGPGDAPFPLKVRRAQKKTTTGEKRGVEEGEGNSQGVPVQDQRRWRFPRTRVMAFKFYEDFTPRSGIDL